MDSKGEKTVERVLKQGTAAVVDIVATETDIGPVGEEILKLSKVSDIHRKIAPYMIYLAATAMDCARLGIHTTRQDVGGRGQGYTGMSLVLNACNIIVTGVKPETIGSGVGVFTTKDGRDLANWHAAPHNPIGQQIGALLDYAAGFRKAGFVVSHPSNLAIKVVWTQGTRTEKETAQLKDAADYAAELRDAIRVLAGR